MTSAKTSSGRKGTTRVLLDANVLAKPVTRTLLLVGGPPSGFRALWSAAAERESERHMRPRATLPSAIRERFGFELSASGELEERFSGTKGADRQILADAVAARAQFLVTEDVDDFAEVDLQSVEISAVNPDVFLAERLTREAYGTVIDLFVERQLSPPTTRGQFHAAIARSHPRLFQAHRDIYEIEVGSDAYPHGEARVLFRGTRCLRCETVSEDQGTLVQGICEACRFAM